MARRAKRQARAGGDVTRERIITAALEVFAEQGFEGAKTREIAARAGTNLGLIKYYFDSKEKLWRAAVDRVFGELAAALGGAPPRELDRASLGGAPPRELDRASLAAIVRELVRFAATNPSFIRIMNDEGKRGGARMRWLVDRHQRPLYDAASAILCQAVAKKLLPDVPPIHLFYVLIGAVGMIFSQAPECERLTGIDPTASDAAIEAHANAVVVLLIGRER